MHKDIIIGLKESTSKRSQSQYDLLMGHMLSISNLSDEEFSNFTEGIRRSVSSDSIYHHAMRMLYPNCGGAFYQVSQHELEILMLPFSDKILCDHQINDLDNKIGQFRLNKGQ